MNRFDKYKKGTITIEIQSLIPEKFINLLWKNEVQIRKVRKLNITTMTLEINLKDFKKVDDIAKKTKTRMKIIGRTGIAFFLIKMRKRVALTGGIALFGGMLYYLSTFIWGIDIETGGNLTPYEIRQQLFSMGIKPGMSKSSINVYLLEDKMMKNNDNIMWIKARIEGARLKVNAEERISPPNINSDSSPSNLVAKRDGQIIRVYTTAGTAVIKNGDIVKAGQIIVKGEQGKEGSTYAVHANGDVIAKTYYEEVKEVPFKGVKKERTGKKVENAYAIIRGKKIYLKNSLNKFLSYDKIEDNSGFIKKEIYYELKEVEFSLNPKDVIDNTVEELYSKITLGMDKTTKILNKVVDTQPQGNNYRIRVVVEAEENIAVSEKSQ